MVGHARGEKKRYRREKNILLKEKEIRESIKNLGVSPEGGKILPAVRSHPCCRTRKERRRKWIEFKKENGKNNWGEKGGKQEFNIIKEINVTRLTRTTDEEYNI